MRPARPEVHHHELGYRLDHGMAIPEVDPVKWREWMEEKGSKLKTSISGKPFRKDLTVGVKFMGKEGGLDPEGRPLLWLVAVFRDGKCQKTEHYASLNAALEKMKTKVSWRKFMKTPLMGWVFEKYMLWQIGRIEGKFNGFMR